MEPLTIFHFFKETVLFLCAVYFYFYLPGRWILSTLRLTNLSPEPFVLPISIGVVCFSLFAYLASWMHILPLVLLPICIIAIISFRRLQTSQIDPTHRMPLIIVFILGFIFSLPRTLGGIWGNTFAYVMDDTLHLAYTNELIAHFPPDHPGFAGTALKGYHFFLDFFEASVSQLTTIPVTSLHFHYVPLLISLGLALGIYSLVLLWTGRTAAALWGVFLGLFGGSFGFILRLQGHANISLASVFGMDQPASAILNMPFAFSLLLITTTLILWHHYAQDKKIGWLFLSALCVGVSPIFKVYGGILLFAGLSWITFSEFFHRNIRAIGPFVLAVLIALGTYMVFAGPGNYLIFFPLWAPHRVLEWNLPWYGFAEKYYTYHTQKVLKGIIEIELYGLALFLLGNLGTRLIGAIIHAVTWVKTRRSPTLFAQTLFVMTATSITIPLLFIQSIKVFEMIQLTFYYPFFMALFGAYGLAKLYDLSVPNLFRWIIILSMIAMTLPSTYEIFSTYVWKPKSSIQLSDQKAYRYLATHGTYEDTILELPADSVDNTVEKLILWHKGSSAQFAAYANKRSFYNSTEIDFPNLDIEGRANILLNIRTLLGTGGTNKEQFASLQKLMKLLKDHHIVYLYSPHPLKLLETFGMNPVFVEGSIYIYTLAY